jgi:hypothetical protein
MMLQSKWKRGCIIQYIHEFRKGKNPTFTEKESAYEKKEAEKGFSFDAALRKFIRTTRKKRRGWERMR